MKETRDIIEHMFNERNTSPRTRETYTRCTRYFENITGHPLPALLNIAETEEENNTPWKSTSLRQWLIQYREWCYKNYKKTTADIYFVSIITLFRHFEITINPLPYFSTKHTIQPTPINPDLLVDREILKLCINTNNPLIKAITLLMSSSGITRVDALNLTINDYLQSTLEYHHANDINQAIETMTDDVIPTWNITRQKTGVTYYTFSSPESTQAINNYLLTRQDNDPRLFKINQRYLSYLFKKINDDLGLGRNGEFSRFAPHMLRRYHATQLIEAGFSDSKVDLLQGRKPRSIAYQSYVKIKPSKLREEYIQALPFLVIEDYNRVKTELDLIKEENQHYKDNLNDLWNELKDLKRRQEIWDTL